VKHFSQLIGAKVRELLITLGDKGGSHIFLRGTFFRGEVSLEGWRSYFLKQLDWGEQLTGEKGHKRCELFRWKGTVWGVINTLVYEDYFGHRRGLGPHLWGLLPTGVSARGDPGDQM